MGLGEALPGRDLRHCTGSARPSSAAGLGRAGALRGVRPADNAAICGTATTPKSRSFKPPSFGCSPRLATPAPRRATKDVAAITIQPILLCAP